MLCLDSLLNSSNESESVFSSLSVSSSDFVWSHRPCFWKTNNFHSCSASSLSLKNARKDSGPSKGKALRCLSCVGLLVFMLLTSLIGFLSGPKSGSQNMPLILSSSTLRLWKSLMYLPKSKPVMPYLGPRAKKVCTYPKLWFC